MPAPTKGQTDAPDEKEYPDKQARDRFERAVDIAVATKPQHRETEVKSKSKRR